MNLELHKELYFFEWSRKEQLGRAANLPVALLTVLVGGLFFLLRSFPYATDLATTAFLVFVFAGLAAVVVGVVLVALSSQGYWYQEIPPSDKLQDYFEELKAWHETAESSPEECQKEFDAFLQGRLAEATAANLANNTRMAAALDNATRAILFALAFVGLSLLPYFPQVLDRAPTPITVVCRTCESKETQHAGTAQGAAPEAAAPAGGAGSEARAAEQRRGAEGRRNAREEVEGQADTRDAD